MSAVSDVEVPVHGGAMRAALTVPDVTPAAGVVVLHEAFGLNDDIRRIAARFADEGYVALAPDLYTPGVKALCIARAMVSLARRRGATLDRLTSARDWLAARPDVDGGRVGAVGFCMGGGFALLLGAAGGLRATSVNYGDVPKQVDALRGVCPVVGSYGADDRRLVPAARRLESFLTDLGVPHDVKLYEGVGHSFLNRDHPAWADKTFGRIMPIAYDEDSAEDAWRRILAFFAKHLRGA